MEEAYGKAGYPQTWRLNRELKFPLDLSLPPSHEEVEEVWERLLSQDEDYQRKYLVRHAIDSNTLDYTFLLQTNVRDCLLVWNLVVKRAQSEDDIVH